MRNRELTQQPLFCTPRITYAVAVSKSVTASDSRSMQVASGDSQNEVKEVRLIRAITTMTRATCTV